MELILKYFPDLKPSQIEQFTQLEDLYKDWNSKINLISRKDIDELYLKHVLHSLAIGKFIQFADGTKVMDVGTGGGFPGIPLAILFPNVEFVLLDSIKKKIKVVDEVAKSLKLKNVNPIAERAENIDRQFHFIVSRAVTSMPKFVGWVRPKIKKEQLNEIKNGVIYLKGGNLQSELKDFRRVATVELRSYFEESFFEEKKIVYLPIKYKG